MLTAAITAVVPNPKLGVPPDSSNTDPVIVIIAKKQKMSRPKNASERKFKTQFSSDGAPL
jgi:hypothetical protein